MSSNIMNKWESVTFGKSGKYFKLCYLVMLLYGSIILTVAGFILFPREYDLLNAKAIIGNTIIILMALYFLWISVRTWNSLDFISQSVQGVSNDEGNGILIRLFNGTVYRTSGRVDVVNNVSNICAPSVNYLYPEDKEDRVQMIISCEFGDFYAVADNDGYEKIKNILVQSKK